MCVRARARVCVCGGGVGVGVFSDSFVSVNALDESGIAHKRGEALSTQERHSWEFTF